MEFYTKPLNSIQNLYISTEFYTKPLNKTFYHSKIQLQKGLNIFLLNILLKTTNSNIFGHSLQGKMQTFTCT